MIERQARAGRAGSSAPARSWLTELSTDQLRDLFALEAGAVVE